MTEEGAEKQEALDAVIKAQERVDTIKSDIKKKIEEKILENTN